MTLQPDEWSEVIIALEKQGETVVKSAWKLKRNAVFAGTVARNDS
jgi:hypothetical protein